MNSTLNIAKGQNRNYGTYSAHQSSLQRKSLTSLPAKKPSQFNGGLKFKAQGRNPAQNKNSN